MAGGVGSAWQVALAAWPVCVLLVCFTASPPYGDAGGGRLCDVVPKRPLGVLETMMRQMIGI